MRGNIFVLCLFAAVGLAFLAPLPQSEAARHLAELAANGAVALIFLLQGVSLATREMLAGGRPLRMHVFVLGWNFICFPVLAALLNPAVLLLGMPEFATGLWMLAILPTTIASATALTAAAGGAVPQAIFASIFSNLLAILLVPLLAVAYLANASGVEVPLLPVFSKLCWIVLLPLVLGQCLRRCCRGLSIAVSQRAHWVPKAAILYIVYVSFQQTVSSEMLERFSAGQLVGMLVLVTLFLLLTSWGVWRSLNWMQLQPEERVAAFYTASQKSIATGLPLLIAIFAAASLPMDMGAVLLPLLIYHALQLFLGGILVPRFARKVRDQKT